MKNRRAVVVIQKDGQQPTIIVDLQLPLFVKPFEFVLGGAARGWSLSPF